MQPKSTIKSWCMQVLMDYPIEDVIDYIDWNPFFQVRVRGAVDCGHLLRRPWLRKE